MQKMLDFLKDFLLHYTKLLKALAFGTLLALDNKEYILRVCEWSKSKSKKWNLQFLHFSNGQIQAKIVSL